ncbi:hypothetical protein CRG98_012824 [Punica granatum]|uniref:Uncharacterized protein n=1 Tax=Punica granatum TaxID=22663 RepID=A0A2I0KE82_PUNGR|nr:hypothetical protein CRG98_012824 [Punica granatum]
MEAKFHAQFFRTQPKITSVDLARTHEIFDFLVKSGLVKFGPSHKHPSAEETRNQDFCRFHYSWRHSIKDYVILRNIIQDKMDQGILTVGKKPIKVDTDPFLAIASILAGSVDLQSILSKRKPNEGLCLEVIEEVTRHVCKLQEDHKLCLACAKLVIQENIRPSTLPRLSRESKA